MISDSTAEYLDGPDYDETTDPEIAEQLAQVDEWAELHRAELDRDQAAELAEHGNSGPGGPFPAGDYNRGIAANTMRDNAASRDLPLAEHEARRADELDEDQAAELDRPMCSWGVISRGGLATMYGACILPADHPREDGHLILGTDGRYYRARLR